MEPGPSNRIGRSVFGVILVAAFAGLAAFAWTQQRAVLQLRGEKLVLGERVKELERLHAESSQPSADQQTEIDKLREDNKDLLRLRAEVSRLRALTGEAGISGAGTNETRRGAETEIEKLREDNKDLLHLRNEVRQLREQSEEIETLRAANTRLFQILQDGSISNLMASVTAVRKQGSLLGIQIIPTGTQAYRGALIGDIMPDAPAAQSGLKSGDIIIGLDGHPIGSAAQLQAEMLTRKPGETVLLDIMRNNEAMRFPVQTRAWPE
jgi:hypothetical protein